MSVKFNSDIIVLSEGLADKAFLERIAAHWLPAYSVAFPYPTNAIGGVSAFTTMLQGIRALREPFGKLKGVLLVADSCDDPAKTFATVIAALAAADHYPIPAALDTVAPAANDHPATAVTTIPSIALTGGLETLYNIYLDQTMPVASAAVDTFLSDGSFDVATWNAEKQGKAKYASFVAATNREDPSRAASAAYRNPPIIDVTHVTFKPLADTLRNLLDGLST